jgi:hypothetical protein
MAALSEVHARGIAATMGTQSYARDRLLWSALIVCVAQSGCEQDNVENKEDHSLDAMIEEKYDAQAESPSLLNTEKKDAAADSLLDATMAEAPPGLLLNARSVCREPEKDPVWMATPKALSEALVGAWIYCGSGSVPFARNDTLGIRFNDDGTWAFLTIEGAKLRRLEGLDNRGSWEVINNRTSAYSFQVNLNLFGGGLNPISPVITSPPLRLRMSWMLGKADYVRAP